MLEVESVSDRREGAAAYSEREQRGAFALFVARASTAALIKRNERHKWDASLDHENRQLSALNLVPALLPPTLQLFNSPSRC